jgi:peptidoglycan/LPS O-acetylase OafA/YrhL
MSSLQYPVERLHDFRYRPDIDGLRALAIVPVLTFHYAQRPSGGFVGVDIFFVISGFLISSILYEELEAEAFSLREFYVRRIRRIYPALILVLAAVGAAAWLLSLPTDFVRIGAQIAGSSAFVANFVLWHQKTGYFVAPVESSPLLHLWSLGVEEQFYLLFPAICLVFSKRRWGLPVSLLVIASASMALNLAYAGKHPNVVFYFPFSRMWELFAGAGLGLLSKNVLREKRRTGTFRIWGNALSIVGLALLVLSLGWITPYDLFPGWVALGPVFGTASLIAAGPEAWINRYLLAFKPARWVGLISYPLYMWHWPILCFFHTYLLQKDPGAVMTPMQKVAAALMSVALAWMTYRFVELPIRGMKAGPRRGTSAMWLLGSGSVVGVLGLLIVVQDGFPSRVPSSVASIDHDYTIEMKQNFRDGTCFLEPNQSAAEFSNACVDPEGGGASKPMVLIWGDSHAADLMPGLRSVATEKKLRLAQYTSGYCAPVVGLDQPDRRNCKAVNDWVIARIGVLKPDVVLLSAEWGHAQLNQSSRSRDLFERTITAIKAAGVKKVVIVGSAPSWAEEVPKLVIARLEHAPQPTFPLRLPRRLVSPQNDGALIAIAERTGSVYVPIIDRICDNTGCLAATGPRWQDVLAYDRTHFTAQGAAIVAQSIGPSL